MKLPDLKPAFALVKAKTHTILSRMESFSPRTWLMIAAGGILARKLLESPYVAATATTQITMVIAAAMAGYGIGWFCSPSAASLRKIILSIAALFLMGVALGDGGMMGWSVTYVAAMVAFAIALGVWTGAAARAFFAKPTTFGSAEWATLDYCQENGLIGEGGIRLGYVPSKEGLQPLHYTGDRHMLVIAPTRAGKGTSVIIPNLLTYEGGSVLVIDPKGENAMITAEQRGRMGSDIHIVDPWGIATNGNASHFNPLDWLDLEDPDIAENAMILADALVMPKASGDPFWSEEAKGILQGLILYVATDPSEAHRRHLGRVRDLLLLDGDDLKLLWQRMVDSEHHVVASTGARSLQKDPKLMSNVIASAQAETVFLDSGRIRESLSKSSFKFEDLKTRPMSVFLVLPADRLSTFGRWLRLLIQQAITVNARNITLKPEKPVLFLLDELPALGRLNAVEVGYGLLAGYGMTLIGVAQDLSQLRKVYGEGGYESLISNSGALVYMGSRDKSTAEYFSSLCGMTTVWNISTAISRAISVTYAKERSSSSSDTSSETSAQAQRPLAYPDELMRLPNNRHIVIVENHHAVIGVKVPWFENENLKTLGRNLFSK